MGLVCDHLRRPGASATFQNGLTPQTVASFSLLGTLLNRSRVSRSSSHLPKNGMMPYTVVSFLLNILQQTRSCQEYQPPSQIACRLIPFSLFCCVWSSQGGPEWPGAGRNSSCLPKWRHASYRSLFFAFGEVLDQTSSGLTPHTVVSFSLFVTLSGRPGVARRGQEWPGRARRGQE